MTWQQQQQQNTHTQKSSQEYTTYAYVEVNGNDDIPEHDDEDPSGYLDT